MKEQYVKPMIFFESFSLTQTIARQCGTEPYNSFGESNHYNENTCEWVIGGDYTLFFTAETSGRCDDGPDEAGDEYDFEGFCYNNPENGHELFSST